jgi:hypothetical protein
MHLMVYMIAERHSGICTNDFAQTFLSLLERLGQSGLAQKVNPAKK